MTSMVERDAPMCPGCNEAPASARQKNRPHLCRWCGFNHETQQNARFVPASLTASLLPPQSEE